PIIASAPGSRQTGAPGYAGGDRRGEGLEGCGVDEPGGQRLPQTFDRWLVILAHFSSFRAG
ncbi:MAG TPA: hypothetical protein PLC86_21455, partial [Candidatus Accumulibacter phosphatis]|nr:hypothetical protein [Candidatus Accumulibacter phosphatis]